MRQEGGSGMWCTVKDYKTKEKNMKKTIYIILAAAAAAAIVFSRRTRGRREM